MPVTGRAAPREPALNQQLIADTGELESHVSCRGCGYDLFGLHTARLCPECGSPISDSVRIIWLRGPEGKRANPRLQSSVHFVELALLCLGGSTAFLLAENGVICVLLGATVLLGGIGFLLAIATVFSEGPFVTRRENLIFVLALFPIALVVAGIAAGVLRGSPLMLLARVGCAFALFWPWISYLNLITAAFDDWPESGLARRLSRLRLVALATGVVAGAVPVGLITIVGAVIAIALLLYALTIVRCGYGIAARE